MTHSGGQPHAVGDRGQRYEVTVLDENKGERIVIGWSDDAKAASGMGSAAELRPSWKLAQVRDRRVTLHVRPSARDDASRKVSELAKYFGVHIKSMEFDYVGDGSEDRPFESLRQALTPTVSAS